MVNMEYTLIKQDFSHLFMFECVRESGRQRGGGGGLVMLAIACNMPKCLCFVSIRIILFA